MILNLVETAPGVWEYLRAIPGDSPRRQRQRDQAAEEAFFNSLAGEAPARPNHWRGGLQEAALFLLGCFLVLPIVLVIAH